MSRSSKPRSRRERKPCTNASFFFDDFETVISNPWDRAEIELSFNDASRKIWQRVPELDVEIFVNDEVVPLDGYVHEPGSRSPGLAYMNVPLGKVAGTRLMVSGRTDDLGATAVGLHVEPGDVASEIRVTIGGCDQLPRYWCDTLSEAFAGIVKSLCDGSYPPALPMLLAAEPYASAAGLIREGWGDGGAEAYCPGLDSWWDRIDLDLDALLADIEARRSDASRSSVQWGVVRKAEGAVRLLCPLVTETFRVDLAHSAAPVFVGSRYWLAVDVAASGRLDDVTVRRDRDPTFDAEGEDPEESMLGDRLNETAYSLVTWIVEDFARKEEA